jgi:hypothetical protein
MVFIGLISYPLYLWHWPLLSVAQIFEGKRLTPLMTLEVVVTAFILAVLTYKYIELPIRSYRNKGLIAGALCAAMAVSAGIGYMTFNRGIQARSDSFDLDRFTRPQHTDWLPGTHTPWTAEPDGFLTLGKGARRVLFIGDSNMQQYYRRISKVLADHPMNGHGAIFAARASCALAVSELESPGDTACRAFLREAIEYAKDPNVDTIVITALWYEYLAAGDWWEFGPRPLKLGTDSVLANLKGTIASLVSRGKRVYVVLNIPVSPNFDPRSMVRRSLGSPGFKVEVHSPTKAEVQSTLGPIVSKVREIAREAGAIVVDPMDSLCGEVTCPAVSPTGEPIYHDAAHLSPLFVEDNVRFLDQTVLDTTAQTGSRP